MARAPGLVSRIILGDCADVLPTLPEGLARLVYIDPPFNTKRVQKRDRIRVKRAAEPSATASPSEAGGKTRKGFAGRTYATEAVPSASYGDAIDDYVPWLVDRIAASLHATTSDASIFVHLDAREVHYVKVALDGLFGRDAFMNEIIWAYDFGGRSRRAWPKKHDTILWYARDPDAYVFDHDAIDRIPYMAPGLVTPEKAARGKTPTDVWWHTIVPTSGREKTGYPTQKPLGVVERIIKVHSEPGDVVLDFFAGSGTAGDAAARNGRGFVLVDQSPEAVDVCARRLAAFHPSIERAT